MLNLPENNIKASISSNSTTPQEPYILILSQIPAVVLENEEFDNAMQQLRPNLVDMAHEREAEQDFVLLSFTFLPDAESFEPWINALISGLLPQTMEEVKVQVELLETGRKLLPEWTVEEVCTWLRRLNPEFSSYCGAFRQESVNGVKLMQITPKILSTVLGVENSLHRLYILKEIKATLKEKKGHRESSLSECSKQTWITPDIKASLAALFDSTFSKTQPEISQAACIHQTNFRSIADRSITQACEGVGFSKCTADEYFPHHDDHKAKESEIVGLITGSVKKSKSFLSIWGILLSVTSANQLITAMILYNQDTKTTAAIIATLQTVMSVCLSLATWFFFKMSGDISLADILKFYLTTILWFAGLYLMIWCFDQTSMVVQDDEIWDDGLEVIVIFIFLSTQIQTLVFFDHTYSESLLAHILTLLQLLLAIGFLSLMIQQVMVIRIWERRKLSIKIELIKGNPRHKTASREKFNLIPLTKKLFPFCPRLGFFCNEICRIWILPLIFILRIVCFSLVYFSGGERVLEDNSPGSMAVAAIFSTVEFLFLWYSWKQAEHLGISMEPKFFLQYVASLSLFWAGIYFLIDISGNGIFEYPMVGNEVYSSKVWSIVYFSLSTQLHHGSGVTFLSEKWIGQIPIITQLMLSTPCLAILLSEALLWIPSIKQDRRSPTKNLVTPMSYGAGRSKTLEHANSDDSSGPLAEEIYKIRKT